MTDDVDPTTDRIVRAVTKRLHDLERRVDFLEKALLPDLPAPTSAELAGARAARSAALGLDEEIASIGSSLESVIASLDSARATPPPPPPLAQEAGSDRPPALASEEHADADVVVDLTSAGAGHMTGQARTRTDPKRPSGWQPAPTRKAN